jgi:OPA family glycerol-3-phosphate transporter-like MFS transporter
MFAQFLGQLWPVVVLLLAVVVLYGRLPRVDLGYSARFLARRRLNWLPLGLTYAFLYMGRYNLTVSKNALGEWMTKQDFGTIFFWGTLVYGVAFVINGPLADAWGGRKTILLAAVGSACMNVLMGCATYFFVRNPAHTYAPVPVFSFLYAANMYFQSFGAVAIVKTNASWFHVKERGSFGGVFGVLISLGIYFAYDWGRLITETLPVYWVFWIPPVVLAVCVAACAKWVYDKPSDVGLEDIATGDAVVVGQDEVLGVWQVAQRMLSNPAIVLIACVEFCSGFLRNAMMQWYVIFAKQVGFEHSVVFKHWGMWLCIAGILGGVIAGVVSDRFFGSRRGPVAVCLYACMTVGSVLCVGLLHTPWVGAVIVLMSLCVIGVHGMLSGTASMDFGGKRNAGVAVGLIDGCVYLGTALQSIVLGSVLPVGEMQKNPSQWWAWPWVMCAVCGLGTLLSARLWHAHPNNIKTQATVVVKENLVKTS